jgi:hypothetical protein
MNSDKGFLLFFRKGASFINKKPVKAQENQRFSILR